MSDTRIDLSRVIGFLVVIAGITALAGVVVGGEFGRVLDVAAITALAAAPGVRVVVLCFTWARSRDYKFAAASAALVILITLSVIGTALWR